MTQADIDQLGRQLTTKELNLLISWGYCRVSRKYGQVARIDRPDWMDQQLRRRMPIDEDWYRRCVSQDILTLAVTDALRFPASRGRITGFQSKKEPCTYAYHQPLD